jgi:ABC-type sugar transport system ATPase subunit
VLKLQSITKHFPGVEALREVNFSLENGMIYGLVGENGAGKSTLIKILMGVYQPTKGEIFVNGAKVTIKNPSQARHTSKIDAVFQEPALIPQMNIAENIFLDRLNNFYDKGLINRAKLQNRAKEALNEVGLDVDVTLPVSELTAAEEKLVELSRALSHDPEILILDEITAPLVSSVVNDLFTIMRNLKETGKTLIFISHRLEEVLEVCDEIIVLKDGDLAGIIKNNSERSASSIRKNIIHMMTGTKRGLSFPEKRGLKFREEKVLSLKNIKSDWLNDVSLDVHRGEIVALAGLRRQGQSKLLRTIFGLLPKDRGDLYLDGEKLEIYSPKDAINRGIFYISDRRDQEELWLTHDVGLNISMVSMCDRARFGFIIGGGEKEAVQKIVSKLKIETPSLAQIVRNLSGGNRQKVVLGKYMLARPKVFIADQPTKGLDVGAKVEIYHLLRRLSDGGIPTLAVLTELSEVVNLPDRILVMRDGKIVKEFSGKKINEEKLLDSYYG